MANNKQQKKIVKQEEIDVRPLYKTEPVAVSESVEDIVAGYGAGNSIPDLLRAILTELVKIRVGGTHV